MFATKKAWEDISRVQQKLVSKLKFVVVEGLSRKQKVQPKNRIKSKRSRIQNWADTGLQISHFRRKNEQRTL